MRRKLCRGKSFDGCKDASIAALLLLFAGLLILKNTIIIPNGLNRFLSGKAAIVYAAEEQIQGRLITLDGDAKAYAMMNNTSEVVAEFKKGDTVYVTNENEYWYEIFYQGSTMFIFLGGDSEVSKSSSEMLDTETVAAEIEHQSQIDKAWIESYLEQMKAIRNARIWRIAILVIVAAVIGLIIFKSIHQKAPEQSTADSKE